MMRQAALNWRDRVLDVLSHVPDPEIPVVSVVELGIVRDVQENPPRVVITTTYSGCPATQVIQADIRKALDDAALREQMGANGRAYAEEKFDIAKIASRFLALG